VNIPVAGADISALTHFERHGAVYRDARGREGDAIRILMDAGMNCFRLRLFVDPDHDGVVVNDLGYTLALARRIKAAGAKLMLDIHYSDTWADPSKQFRPKSWEGMDFDALCAKVRGYTREVVTRFAENGAMPDSIQLGNEITNGMLWPDGRVEFATPDADAWDRFAALQNAAYDGLAEACDGRALPAVILHIESTGNLPRTAWFLDEAAKRGVRYDILGLSYYPQWHGTMDELSKTLNFASEKSGRPVMVVETAYPWKMTADWSEGRENLAFPATPQGQNAFAMAVVAALRNVPQNRGIGIMWWYPEAVLNPSINVWLGGDCALFSDGGRLLPAAFMRVE
jgi:arabinogalactan endo-1,4-beta-galactosidase